MQRQSEQWGDEVLAAHSLRDDGDNAAAEAEWERLRERAPTRARYRWVTYEIAESAEERGDHARALALAEELYTEDVVDEYGANALLMAARVHEHLEKPDEADALRRRLLVNYSNEMAAERALEYIVDEYTRAERWDALETFLEQVYPDLKDTYLADNVLWYLARHYDRDLGDADRALEVYRRLYRDHHDEMLADDAIWEMANIYRRYQRWEPAIHNLKIISEDTESSWFVGDYNSQWVDNAIFDLGLIHLLFLSDYDAAVDYFERYVEDYEFSDYADDAFWNACEARRLQGDEQAHLQMLKRFLRKFPESRYADRARARLGQSDQP